MLYGPTSLGGFGLSHPRHSNTLRRLNYFLYNCRLNSDTTKKLKLSIIYAQIETGSFMQFFSLPYKTHTHMITTSFVKQLWYELEPYGLYLKPAQNATWVPTPLDNDDISLIDIATQIYNAKGSAIINRCRLYLQFISTYDLLLFHSTEIHPAYLTGCRPPSRRSPMLWPTIPPPPPPHPPPQKNWGLWGHFLRYHVFPKISNTKHFWGRVTAIRMLPSFFKHRHTPHLYYLQGNDLTMFKLAHRQQCHSPTLYTNVPYDCNYTFNNQDFFPVETYQSV